MFSKKRTVLAVCMSLCCSAVLLGGTLTKEFRKVLDFRQDGTFSLKNVNGNIEVESWNRESVEIYAEIEVRAGNRRDAEEFLRRVEIVIEQDRDRIHVEADYPKVRGDDFFDWIFGNGKPRLSIKYWIRIPSRTDLILKSTNGRVEVTEVEGLAELATTNGNIHADRMVGAVEARTTNGGIKVEMDRLYDREGMLMRTTNGSIQLSLPRNIEADIEASTTNGGISTDFRLRVEGRFNSKRIRGRINGGGPLIELHTTNGGIRIYEE